jgi:hypothetical protein
VGDYFFLVVPGIYDWLEDLHFLPGELGAFQTSDQFLGFARKHGAADHFDPTELFFVINRVFEKHFVNLDENPPARRYP